MEPILRVQNLTKTFTRSGQSNLTAVNGISFDLLPGECLGIIGESGSADIITLVDYMIEQGPESGKFTVSDHAASGCDRRKDFSGWRGHYAENGKITPHDLSENADGFPDTDRFL